MTTPVTPPATPTVPTYPPLGSPTFNQDAYAFGSAMPGVATGIGALATNAAQNAQISHDNSELTLQAKDLAVTAAEEAAASVNFLGYWVDQTGSAAKGVSVKHNNRIWRSVVTIPNIALAEPGVSASWTSAGGSVVIQRVATSSAMTVGVSYVATAPGITLTAPATLMSGDVLELSNATNDLIYCNFNGFTVKGQTPDSPMLIPALRGFRLTYDGVTLA